MNSILYCGNYKAFDGILLSLLSVVQHYREPLSVYIMTVDLSDIKEEYKPVCWQQANYLERVLTAVNYHSRVTLVDMTKDFRREMESGANFDTPYTPYALLRLYADRIRGVPDRLLYLDADTVACRSIEEIFEAELSGYEFGAVRDYLGKWFINYRYMNTGVLYLNMKRIMETGLFVRARRMCAARKMWFPDQTALNRLVRKKLFLPRSYNEQRRYREDTVIQHFCKSLRLFPYIHTVNVKPWEVERMHHVFHLYVHDEILKKYEKHREVYRCCNME